MTRAARPLCVALLLLLAASACSKEQLGTFVQNVCQGWDHCTVYDKNGEPARDWPTDRPKVEP